MVIIRSGCGQIRFTGTGESGILQRSWNLAFGFIVRQTVKNVRTDKKIEYMDNADRVALEWAFALAK